MTNGWLFITGISDGSLLCDVDEPLGRHRFVAYQMALFAERAGQVLTPEVREELKMELVASK